ncbi:hypothetical protein [Pseudobdellovibrio exovorus]|uniref:Uncharacterized protein n=1 Tax=Pseudobdellovibrio exovorus JSS TaxID=1184267 RepID=M4V825_9BACT|nr:hypothetical protein [Pseudobdellovibrio exovorus]AGH95532.1 hypothetical protein A11Q_1316 [Pseudobdellovibrio exovorus JSS]
MQTISILISVLWLSSVAFASLDFGLLIKQQIQVQQETHEKMSEELDLNNREEVREKVTVSLPNIPVVAVTTTTAVRTDIENSARVEQKEFNFLNEELKIVE